MKKHYVQFQVPGSPWCWVTAKGTGTLSQDQAFEFKDRDAADTFVSLRSRGNTSVRYKAVSL